MMKNGFICESANIEELDPEFADVPIVRQADGQCQGRCGDVEQLRLRRHQRNPRLPALQRLTHMTKSLMKGRRGLVMGVANDHSIAWGIAQQLHAHGAELAFTYQGEAFGKRVKPLADSLGSKLLLPCDVEDIATVDGVFAELQKAMGHASISSCMPSPFPTRTS